MHSTELPAPALRGLAVFMGLMTSAWSLNAHPAAPRAVTWGAALLGIMIVVRAVLVRPRGETPDHRRPDHDSEPSAGGNSRPAGSRLFGVAVAAELLAGAVAVAVLVRAGLPGYITPVIALIVALHFLIFLIDQRTVIHLLAGTAGSLGAVLAIVLMATGTAGPEAGRAIAGLTLAACTLTYGIVFLRALRGAPAPGGTRTSARISSAHPG
jgi:hypothetical protein